MATQRPVADLYSQAIGNMVQGVSQQIPEQRRDSQCEAQFDCRNDPADGVIPRPHFEFLFKIPGVDFTGGYFYETARGNNEHYLSVFSGNDVKVYDLADGTACTVTKDPAGNAYLNAGVGVQPRDNFDAQAVDDYNFVMSKAKVPAMSSAVHPVRPKEALIYVRAAGYLTTYAIAITYNNKVYTWKYRTPDNYYVVNQRYATTNQIAATLYRAMAGTAAPVTTSGTNVSSSVYGLQATEVGDTGGSGGGEAGTPSLVEAPITATSLGFSLQITGNVIRVWRTDGVDFKIDATDSQGDTFLRAFKETISTFSDLPRSGFLGMNFKVAGADKNTEDDYYVEFKAQTTGEGVWSECPGPGAHTTLDPLTMPHALINTGYRTFTWGPLNWSTRIAGDEANTKNPYFVGKVLQDIYFFNNRLGLLTPGAADHSKTYNEFTFFPDTAQTALDTDRISIRLTASGNARNQGAALMRKAVQCDESLFLWAQRAQFRVHSGQDAFKPSTVQSAESTSYEFSETVDPLSLGQRLYFVSEVGNWSTFRSISFTNGRAVGDASLTEHVPKYVPRSIRDLCGLDTDNIVFLRSDEAPHNLYCYQFLFSGNDLLQSAWNTWRLPAGTILWTSVFRSGLYVALQRADGVVVLRAELNKGITDPGGDYVTRLDMRVSEANTSLSFASGNTTITLPYQLPEGLAGKPGVYVREDLEGGYTRGRQFPVLSVSGNQIVVAGDLRPHKFYAGLHYAATREESKFHIRTQNGPAPNDRIQVHFYRVIHSASSYYRIEVKQDGVPDKVTHFNGRILGQSSGTTGTPKMSSGDTKVEVAAANTNCTITLINDSPFPSAWAASEYQYTLTRRAVPNTIK